MEGAASQIRYLIFDIETTIDGDLVAKTRYQSDGVAGKEAINRYRNELASATAG